MSTKLKIVLGVSVLINLAAFGYFGYGRFKSQQISDSKAVVAVENQKANETKLAENAAVNDFEIAKEEIESEVKIEEEVKKEEEKVESGKISLSGKTTSSGVSLSWTANNLGSFDGFKIVKSKEANPVYPGSEYQYLSSKDARSYSWSISSGSKYHFRVCQYAGGKCVLYSNDIYLNTPEKDESGDGEYASSVSLSLSEEGGKKYLKWSISGGDAPKGYKVVKAKDKNPKYPDDGYYQYISDGDTKKVKLEGFDSDDKYHFRVCIYKGGSCGAYSNDVEVSF